MASPPAARTRIPLQDPPPEGWSPCIISPEVASLKCKDRGVKGVLRLLNQALAGDLGREILISDPGVEQLLGRLVNGTEDYNFGSLYARVRNLWRRKHLDDVNKVHSELIKFSDCIDEARKACVTGDFIHVSGRNSNLSLSGGHTWARRLWDLRAHRVVPYRFSLGYYNISADVHKFALPMFFAVSHSWTSTMSGVDTAVNGREWLVPLPSGVTLEAIRNELLHLKAEYVWLDVVCLRQFGVQNEELRKEEWAVDIPTIHTIYQCAWKVIRYYNGLGVAFKCKGWTGQRHWLRRVWTIQEIHSQTMSAGLPEGLRAEDLLEQNSEEDGRPLRVYLRSVEILESNLAGLYTAQNLLLIIKELRERFATKPIDKIAACGALLPGALTKIPLYKECMDVEDAWELLVKCMPGHIPCSILWKICTPGEGKCKWRPSWKQLMDDGHENIRAVTQDRDEPLGWLHVLDNNCVRQQFGCRLLTGHASLTWDHADDGRLRGLVQYSDRAVRSLAFAVYADSKQACRDGTVRLVGNDIRNEKAIDSDRWVPNPTFRYLMVCKEVKDAQGEMGFEKISVVHVKDIGPSIFQAEYEAADTIFV
ncbi:hypothetical protein NEOLEDRAFT_1141132 [Neolentinus lepideus HHB14362 ss-1]|uniref:Heterokaryon incompatibility domain-containing protein n=1 Tax=Neolentinus lepideus HHB14362 ss-1 TaxID=1314782 RepID=A0A165NVF0_9AGAM|nr:hypothetical protein NEOLEDRAFT_1141132 [Neolentinus lepideus HHB14362 ss-1]